MRHTFFSDLYAYFFQEEALQIVYVDYDEGHARHSGGDFPEKVLSKKQRAQTTHGPIRNGGKTK
jgi:hypothetical protein